MNTQHPTPGFERFVSLIRKEPFKTTTLFFLGFLPTAASLAVLTAFVVVQFLAKLPFAHLTPLAASAISFAFSLYFVVGYVVWYRHQGFNS